MEKLPKAFVKQTEEGISGCDMVPQVHTELPHPLSWSCYSKTILVNGTLWVMYKQKMKTFVTRQKMAFWTPHLKLH